MSVVLVGGVRTPFCKAGGVLDPLPAHELGAGVLRELIERTEIPASAIDAVVVGNVAGPMEATNIARVIALLAGVPRSAPAHTVSRNCASGMEAFVDAARRVATGEARMIAVVGVESMSRAPIVFPDRFRRLLFRSLRARSAASRLAVWSRLRPGDLKPVSSLRVALTDPVSGLNMGETAEVLAQEFGIERSAQDRYALRSHQRAVDAQKSGRLGDEIAPVFVPPGFDEFIAHDVGPRDGLSLDKLARLKPYFDRVRGTVTAGNASMISDGAVALLVASSDRARELRLQPAARLRGHAVVGCDPKRMGLGPVYATPPALDLAGVSLADIDLVELNEAFAVQVLACLRAFESARFARDELLRSNAVGAIDEERLNVNGGAIALGHPVGASGARLILQLVKELARRQLQLGLATLCVGGGQGQAVVLETM